MLHSRFYLCRAWYHRWSMRQQLWRLRTRESPIPNRQQQTHRDFRISSSSHMMALRFDKSMPERTTSTNRFSSACWTVTFAPCSSPAQSKIWCAHRFCPSWWRLQWSRPRLGRWSGLEVRGCSFCLCAEGKLEVSWRRSWDSDVSKLPYRLFDTRFKNSVPK